MSSYIIRKIRLTHCKQGPSRCEKCREMDAERICVLDISPSDEGKMQRRVIPVNVGGQMIWREFEIVKVFENQEEAAKYAAANGIAEAEY